MLTDVEGVFLRWGTPEASLVRTTSCSQLRLLDFAVGSMGPKVDAACRFVEATGGVAAIGALQDAERVLRGEAGTSITAN
jgi:carbamate kinase